MQFTVCKVTILKSNSNYYLCDTMKLLLIIAASLLTAIGGRPATDSFPEVKIDYKISNWAAAPNIADDLLVMSIMKEMSTEEKVAQLIVIPIEQGQSDRTVDSWVRDWKVGGLMPMADSYASSLRRINGLQQMARIPLLVSIDGEWGAAMRYSEFTSFPRQKRLARQTDSVIFQTGRAIAKELNSMKITVNYAPVADVNNNPANVGVGSRSFGADPHMVARKSVAIMKGMQSEGIIACAKHFPGHGDTSVDSHIGMPVLRFSRERLDSIELVPFKALIENGVKMVMVGHLSVPALDPSGKPASISRAITTDLLRGELGFRGLIVTDALNMRGVLDWVGGKSAQASLAAFKAGADILLAPTDVVESIKLIAGKVDSGEIPVSELDMKCRRVLMAKVKAGLLAPDYDTQVDVKSVNPKINSAFISRLK